MEYTGPVNELKEMCEIRIEVAGILRDCRVSYNFLPCSKHNQDFSSYIGLVKAAILSYCAVTKSVYRTKYM